MDAGNVFSQLRGDRVLSLRLLWDQIDQREEETFLQIYIKLPNYDVDTPAKYV